MTPIVASLTDDNGDGNIDEDDDPDILAVTYGGTGTLRAVNGADGTELWSATNQGLQGQGAIAAGDIDGDGIVEIVACTSSAVRPADAREKRRRKASVCWWASGSEQLTSKAMGATRR